MTGAIIFLALVFGGIAIWAGIRMMNGGDKPAPRPRPRVIAPSPTDPWGVAQMRRGERNSQPLGRYRF